MALPPTLADGLRLPVVGAPMFIVSGPELVIAQCKAGIVGCFPSLNARPETLLDEWLHQIREELDAHDRAHPDRLSAPFAVNQIVHRSNGRLEHDLEACVRHKAPIVITSLGARPEVNEAVHGYGGIVLHDVIHDTFARKAVEKGADGLILVAAGAGGHAGSINPIALVQEARAWFQGPLLLSGCIATGRGVLAAQAMGADLAYIGSAFIATTEANAPPAYRQMIVDGRAEDILYTDIFTGIRGNYLKPSIAAAGLDADNLIAGQGDDLSKLSDARAKAWRDIWGAGQGIGAIERVVPAGDLVARLQAEYAEALAELSQLAGTYADKSGVPAN